MLSFGAAWQETFLPSAFQMVDTQAAALQIQRHSGG